MPWPMHIATHNTHPVSIFLTVNPTVHCSRMEVVLGVVLVLVSALDSGSGLDNGLALTPPMGWMSWQRFRCVTDCDLFPDECISEKLYRKMADLLVDGGYLDAGYEYLILDDCWMSKERDENGLLQADPVRFPSGIKNLADYVHSKGLKLGIYEDYGTYTCGGYPGSIDHLEDDAKTFAAWEVDYVKFDGCYADPDIMNDGYPEFGRYLRATNRSIVYSCSWPVYQDETGIDPNLTLITEHCNLWRNYDDIDDSWASVTDIIDWFSEKQEIVAPHGGPGHWNDPDMLIIGNFGLTVEQAKAQMAVWAVWAAPLIMSNDLRDIRPEFSQILLNKDVIAVNQDKLGIPGRRVYDVDNIEIWTKPIEPVVDGVTSWAITAVSRRSDGAARPVYVDLARLRVQGSPAYNVTELFTGVGPVLIAADDQIYFRIPPSGAKMWKAEAVPQSTFVPEHVHKKKVYKKKSSPRAPYRKIHRKPHMNRWHDPHYEIINV